MPMSYVLPALPYAYDAMEPYIDARTMEIHYTKHHQAYVNNLNAALEKHPSLQKMSLEELLKNIDTLPADIKEAVRNNGGGHYNHSLFWQWLKPNGSINAKYKVNAVIHEQFGSFEQFQSTFNAAAKTVFGSGWAWLCLDAQKKMFIISTPNQDTPLNKNLTPLLGLDVWEHAYYLKYQNRRPDYIDAWWHVVNWEFVEDLYVHALK